MDGGAAGGGVAGGGDVELLKTEARFLGVVGETGGAGFCRAASTVCARLASLAFTRMSSLACFVVAVLRDAFPFFFSSVVARRPFFFPAVFPDPAPLGGSADGVTFLGGMMR